jgi:hypothetical protein
VNELILTLAPRAWQVSFYYSKADGNSEVTLMSDCAKAVNCQTSESTMVGCGAEKVTISWPCTYGWKGLQLRRARARLPRGKAKGTASNNDR